MPSYLVVSHDSGVGGVTGGSCVRYGCLSDSVLHKKIHTEHFIEQTIYIYSSLYV